jgi:hypothetical protein
MQSFRERYAFDVTGSDMATSLSTSTEHIRSTDAYGQAKLLFHEKREVFSKLTAINKKLRELHNEAPEAVVAARNDVPFRNPPGRQKMEDRNK